VKIYTIGFTQKSAPTFFELLTQNGVQRVIDIRLNNTSQLAGFTKKDDFKYFLKELADIEYYHFDFLAPTKEIRDTYNKSKNWDLYTKQFLHLLEKRKALDQLDKNLFQEKACCLLCSEENPEFCHRKLVADALKNRWHDVEIVHL
jgi:uncharacterized protein (DUF488 family)